MATVGTSAGVAGNVNEAMKVIFEEPISDNIVAESELLDIFEQDMNVRVNETTGGRYIELAHYFHLPAGVGARALEGDYIPVPEGPTIRNSQVYLKKIEGTVEMSGDTMRRVRQGEGAFLDWADRALPDLVKRVSSELDRMLIGDGTGQLATVAAIGAADAAGNIPITIANAYGFTGYANPFLLFMENQRVVFGAVAPGTGAVTLRGGATPSRRVVDVSPTGVITVAGPAVAGLVVGDFIFNGDDASQSFQTAAGVEKEIMGLIGMVDDGVNTPIFQGLDRTLYRPWQSVIVDAVTDATAAGSAVPGQFNEDILTFADDQTAVLGAGMVDTLVISREVARQYWRTLRSDRVLNDPRSFTGGKSGLSIQLTDRLITLKVARKLPPSIAFGLQRDTFKRWQNVGWEWDNTTGAIWNRVTDGIGRRDAFYAVGHIVMQTGNVAPRKNFCIRGIDPTL